MVKLTNNEYLYDKFNFFIVKNKLNRFIFAQKNRK